jgi:hypothetical protein
MRKFYRSVFIDKILLARVLLGFATATLSLRRLMNPRNLAFSVLTVLSVMPAVAFAADTTILFDSSGNTPTYPALTTGGGTMAAQEFAGQNVALTAVSLALTRLNPDTGSATVYLIADNSQFQNTGSLTGAIEIATVLDSSLALNSAGTPSLTTLSLTANPRLSAGTEYWIVVDKTGNSSIEWWLNDSASASSDPTQLSANDGKTGWGTFLAVDHGIGQYDLTVAGIAEPATIAVFGIGLAGLGLARRRTL